MKEYKTIDKLTIPRRPAGVKGMICYGSLIPNIEELNQLALEGWRVVSDSKDHWLLEKGE